MSGLLPSMDDKQLDALIQALERVQALEAEVAQLRVENEALRKELTTWQEAHRLMGKKDFYNIAKIDSLRLTDDERDLLRRLGPSADPLASYVTTLSPADRKAVHDLLTRQGD